MELKYWLVQVVTTGHSNSLRVAKGVYPSITADLSDGYWRAIGSRHDDRMHQLNG